jgi:hypothetical protein
VILSQPVFLFGSGVRTKTGWLRRKLSGVRAKTGWLRRKLSGVRAKTGCFRSKSKDWLAQE